MRDLFDFLIRFLMKIEVLDAANPKWNKELRHRIIVAILDDKDFKKKIDRHLLSIHGWPFIICQSQISLMRSNVAIKINAWAEKNNLWKDITNKIVKSDLDELIFIGFENCFRDIEIRKFYEESKDGK